MLVLSISVGAALRLKVSTSNVLEVVFVATYVITSVLQVTVYGSYF